MANIYECIQAVKAAEETLAAAKARVERVEHFIHQFASSSIVGFSGNSTPGASDYTGEYAAKISDAHTAEAEARQAYIQAVMALVDALDEVSADAGRIIHLRYIDGLKMGVVARKMGYSRSHCYKILQDVGCLDMAKGPP